MNYEVAFPDKEYLKNDLNGYFFQSEGGKFSDETFTAYGTYLDRINNRVVFLKAQNFKERDPRSFKYLEHLNEDYEWDVGAPNFAKAESIYPKLTVSVIADFDADYFKRATGYIITGI